MEMKQRAKVREWSEKIAECRGRGKTAKERRREQEINTKTYYYREKAYVTESTMKSKHVCRRTECSRVRIRR